MKAWMLALVGWMWCCGAATQAQPDGVDGELETLHHALYTPVWSQLPALDAKVWGTFSPAPGVLADRVTYATAEGMLVPAIVYRPDPGVRRWKGKLPGIVVVNGHGSDKFGWYAFYTGILLARAGAVVLTYDLIGEGERNAERRSMSRPSAHDADVTPPAPLPKDDWGRRLAGLMQVDLDQGIRYLDSRPEVDAKRVGVLGYSLGAFVAGLGGAMDARQHRIAAVVLSGGGVFDDGAGYYDSNHNPCQGPPYRALAPLGARGEVLYELNAMSHPMLVMNGTADTVMDIPHHDATWFAEMRARVLPHVAEKANVFTSIMYPGVSHRPSWMDRDGMKWLNAHLHFAFWDTDAKIDAQGLTHVSEWITANHVAISPVYFREEREGGIEAVGHDVPAVPRAALMVMPEADWERMKDRLTYEAWAAKTMAAEKTEATMRRKPVSALHEPSRDLTAYVVH